MEFSLDQRLYSQLSSGKNFALLAMVFVLLTIGYHTIGALYNLYIHPLSKIPGPKLAACSRLPYVRQLLKGDLVQWLARLHEEYGDVVRTAPDEVSFISGETAWQDIYGTHTGEKTASKASKHYLKDRRWFAEPYNDTWSILQADAETHSRMRKVIAPAFGDRALRNQEELVQSYVNLFCQQLHEKVKGPTKGVVDIVKWFNFFTFDIIADLTFGEPFYCLENGEYHPWVATLFNSVRAISVNSTVRRYPLFQSVVKRLAPKDLLEKRRAFNMWVFDRVDKRLATGATRPDLVTHITEQEGENMNLAELHSNVNIMLIAGSETTATLLSGCTYMLLKRPETYERLREEVRTTFDAKRPGEITMQSVARLPYLNAVLREALRIYPPNAAGFMRLVPQGGDVISGHWIPEGTSVSVSQWPANHSSRNFVDPEKFAPERFLGDARYEGDNRAVLNPFSFGSRNCLGKALAWAEMRLILARLILEFDMRLVDKDSDWLDQKVYTLWSKTALDIQLTAVKLD